MYNGYGVKLVPGMKYYLLSGDGQGVDHTRYLLKEIVDSSSVKLETPDAFVFTARVDDLHKAKPGTPKPRKRKDPEPEAPEIRTIITPKPSNVEIEPQPYTVIPDALRDFAGKHIQYFSPSDDSREVFTPLDVIRFVHFLDARRGDRLPNPKTCKHVNFIEIEDIVECLDCGLRQRSSGT